MSKEENTQEEEIKNAQESVETQENKEVDDNITTNEELIQQEKDKYLRLFAEFENYKKRTSKERIELFKTASHELMTSLLPIMDDFDRGLAEIKKTGDEDMLKGMLLISDKLKNTLQSKGLTEIEVSQGDSFDAEIHEAITQIPAPTEELKGKIIDAVEKGYKLGDKVIRYPKVVVGQ